MKNLSDYWQAFQNIQEIEYDDLRKSFEYLLAKEVKAANETRTSNNKEIRHYTTAKIRAVELGYIQIKRVRIPTVKGLGNFVSGRVNAIFYDHDTNYYELNDKLDAAIHEFFRMKSLISQ